MLLPELPDLYRLGIEAGLGFLALILFGLLTAASVYVAQRKHAPMNEPPPPCAAELAMDMVRGGILREYKLLPGPNQRMEFLHLIRAELTDLHTLASQELFKLREQSK